uniref:Uncharacterized protein n=1 Tax=Arundo donax TaxID=35708 RepID=A0A0A9GDZ3_ARUDO
MLISLPVYFTNHTIIKSLDRRKMLCALICVGFVGSERSRS